MSDEPGPSSLAATATIKKKRGKDVVPMNVENVRRSNRIAGIFAGFKDKPPIDATSSVAEEGEVNQETAFQASTINESAPAPPLLPVDMLQALGTGPCQIASTRLSEEELNYGSTNDSVESA